MKPLTAKEVEGYLKRYGYRLDRIRGSHHVWVNDGCFSVFGIQAVGCKGEILFRLSGQQTTEAEQFILRAVERDGPSHEK